MTRTARRALLALATTCVVPAAWAADDGDVATRADCDAAAPSRVRHALDPVPHSRAIWLDGHRLFLPNAPGTGRHALHAGDGGIVDIPLESIGDALPADLVPRFPHLDRGLVLSVPTDRRKDTPAMLRAAPRLVRADGGTTGTQIAAALDDLYAAATTAPDVGATVGSTATRFRVWAPTAHAVSLCLFDDGSSTSTDVLAARFEPKDGIWQVDIAKPLPNRYFTWLVDVSVPGVGRVRNRVTDPWSLSLSRDSARTWIGDLGDPALKPAGWDTTPRPDTVQAAPDMAIYELHVRDFSLGDTTVPPAHRGNYLAFTDTESAGMRHLRALAQAGITDIHLLPVFDLASVPEHGCVTPEISGAPDGDTQQAAIAKVAARDCFNWGYDPWHYTAPEGSYASTADDGATRILEFRAMVQALHRAGLRVGMDVVYNHTSASGQDPKSVLDRIVPGYYHRLDADGRVERSTCCENTATEHAMMERLMIDSAVTWATEYRIDSFRFDLMGHQPRAAMVRLQQAVDAATRRHIDLLGEGWNFGEVKDGARFVQASQLALQDSGIATFSDRGRDAVRGGSAGDNGVDQVRNQGWLNGLHTAPNALASRDGSDAALRRAADLIRVGLAGTLRDYAFETASGETLPASRIDYAGQPAGYAAQPGEVVNYVENHDNQTLFDLNAFKLPADTSAAERARVQVLGAALVAFSQGIAYFHAGQDVLRSKSMDRNSFDSGDWFNRLDWTYRDNGFGAGLPPASDNGKSWERMGPALANAAIKPSAADIAWTRDAFRDLLRIRQSSTLFRLRDTASVKQRLRFHNTGPSQEAAVIVGHLDGRGLPGAGFDDVLYLLNTDVREHVLELPETRGRPYVLHPVYRAPDAADRRAAEDARVDTTTGRVTVPPRTAVVFVVPQASTP